MKLALLLAEYLYTNDHLDLPGIGSFHIETSKLSGTEESNLPLRITILFQNDPSIKDVPDLISFIANKTGKMKALAISDLDSHLQIAEQFLNIGKPFMLDGIGSLTKLRSGEYEFTQGNMTDEKIKEFGGLDEESFTDFSKSSSKRKMRPGKMVPLLLLIAGIGIAVLLGYKIYQKRVEKKDDTAKNITETQKEETIPVRIDSSQTIKKTDTPQESENIAKQKPITLKDKYKFVVEEATKERALLRYNSLKSWGLQIQMETTDSVNFKLFFVLPSSASDTNKTMDSLRILYTPGWSKSYVEK